MLNRLIDHFTTYIPFSYGSCSKKNIDQDDPLKSSFQEVKLKMFKCLCTTHNSKRRRRTKPIAMGHLCDSGEHDIYMFKSSPGYEAVILCMIKSSEGRTLIRRFHNVPTKFMSW